jgi:hypothetical protein
LGSDLNRKIYSVDNYDTLTKQDLGKIKTAFEEGRIKIIRFLASRAREEKDAKTYEEIADHMKYSLQAARKHCKMLLEIGVIYQIRSKSHEPSAWAGEFIKFYFVVENMIEIVAILSAVTLGLDKDAAIKIKNLTSRVFEESASKFVYGIYGGKFLDVQEQTLDAVRNIAHNYTEAQKDNIINWWSAVEEFNRRYYYSWLYPVSFANMASQAYRYFADHMISGLTIAQNNTDAYVDMSKIYLRLVNDNMNEWSQMALRAPKMFEPVVVPRDSMSTKATGIPPLLDEQDDEYNYLATLKKLRDDLTEIVQISLCGS